MRTNAARKNVAYALMLLDIQRWLLKRTDLAGHAADMLVKACLASQGAILEALIVDATSPPASRTAAKGRRRDPRREMVELRALEPRGIETGEEQGASTAARFAPSNSGTREASLPRETTGAIIRATFCGSSGT